MKTVRRTALLLAAGIGLVAASTSPPRDWSFKFT